MKGDKWRMCDGVRFSLRRAAALFRENSKNIEYVRNLKYFI